MKIYLKNLCPPPEKKKKVKLKLYQRKEEKIVEKTKKNRSKNYKLTYQDFLTYCEKEGWYPIRGINGVNEHGDRWLIKVTGEILHIKNFDGREVTFTIRLYDKDKSKNASGYHIVYCEKSILLHRIVATMFVENPHGYTEVDHRDGDKDNNAPENLEWVSRHENMRRFYKYGSKSNPTYKGRYNKKKGYYLTKEGQKIAMAEEEYYSKIRPDLKSRQKNK